MDTMILNGFQECKIMKSLQYDIDVPCIMQWEATVVIGSELSERILDQHWRLEDMQRQERSSRQWRPCSLHLWEKARAGQFSWKRRRR